MRKLVAAVFLLGFVAFCPASISYSSEGNPADLYAVQVSACRLRVSADTVVKKLRKEGYTPYVYEITDSNGRAWYVVRLGDYRTLKEAETAAGAFVAREGRDAVVTPVGSMKVLAKGKPGPAEISRKNAPPGTRSSGQGIEETGGGNSVPEAGTATASVKQEAATPPETGKPAEQAVSPQTAARKQAAKPAGEDEAVKKLPEGKAPAPAGDAASLQDLEERINSIEKELKQLQEEREARKKLEVTQAEKERKAKEILSAAGREYTLLKKGTLGVEYNFSYAYYSYDVLREAARIEHHSNHNLTNAVYLEYALFDNLTLNSNIPFVYKYDRSGTSNSKDVNDLGDVSVGVQWQPFKSGAGFLSPIFQATFTLPSGRSPYEINPESELDTGSGYYSAGGGVTFSHTIDPIVAFGSLNYNHNFNVTSLDQNRPGGRILTGVDPGDSISLAMGIGYALSYKVSLNLSYQYAYNFSTTYHWRNAGTTGAAAYASSIFSIGTGWRLSPKRSIYLKVGIGLTNDDPDFLFSVRVPFQFSL